MTGDLGGHNVGHIGKYFNPGLFSYLPPTCSERGQSMGINRTIFISLVIIGCFASSYALAADAVMEELDGFIEPSLVVNVGSSVSGIIESLEVDRGDIVKKDQILARLNSGIEQANVNLIKTRSELMATIGLKKARVEFATREHQRRSELSKKGIIPDYELDEAETNLVIARHELQETEEQQQISLLELKQAEAILERRVIRSPLNGIVVERYLSPGELVSDGPLFRLSQLDPLNVEVIAPVSMLGLVKAGKKAEVRPENPVDKVYVGRVTIVDQVVDAASGTFGIRIELRNKNYALPAGLKCRVRFID